METAPQFGFTMFHRIGLMAFSVVLLILVLELVRRRLFKERYALLWLATAGCGVIVGLFPGIIVWLSKVMHVQFLTVFFLLALLFLLGLVLSFSVVISSLSEQNRALAQELGLLANRLNEIEDKDEPSH